MQVRFVFLITFLFGFCLSKAGNTPCTATVVPNNMTTFQTFNTAGTSDSGFGYPPCGNYEGNDFWIEFVAPSSGVVTIELQAETINDAALNLYWGLCGGIQVLDLGCFEDFDCGADLMPQVTFDELFPGQTYYVKIWEEGGGTGTFGLRVSDPFQQDFVMAGTAIPLQVGDFNCVQLTAAAPGQSGCAWYPTTIDFDQPFEQELALYFGTIDANGADGMTVIFQPNGTNTCGGTGQGIGAQGIPQSWIIEFDTWDNGVGGGDIGADHIAINVNGNMGNPIFGPMAIPYNIEDGMMHFVRVRWNPDTFLFEVYFDNVLYFSVNYNIVGNVFFGNNTVNWGTTGSTGAAVNQQYLCFQAITVTNNTSYTFEVDEILCAGMGTFVGGSYQTEAGTYVDVYTAQNGCDSTIYTNIEVVNVEAIATEIVALPCGGGSDEVMLDATASITGQQPSINWSTSDGTIIDGKTTLTPTVSGGGTYTLTVLDLYSGCSDGAIVQVITAEIPIADAGATFELSCQTTSNQLNGTGSSTGTDFSYEWTTLDGSILTDTFSQMPSINAAGTYNLLVTNTQSGCTAQSSVTITANQAVPLATAIAENNLDCVTNQVQLNGQGSSEATGIEYLWESAEGNFIANANTLQATVSAAGTYTLLVMDTNSACTSSFPVEVTSDIEPPIAAIEPPLVLDCINTEQLLNALNSSQGTPFSYEWTSNDATIAMDANTLMPLVNESGMYQLLVSNTENGCTATAQVQVTQNIVPPLAEAGLNQTLTCTEIAVELDAAASDSGTNLVYQWTNLDDNTILNSTQNNPTITVAGTYEFLITNTDNMCTASDQVSVVFDTISPQTIITPPDLLTCTQTSLDLEATALNNTGNFTYQWSTIDGQIENGATTLMPTISSTGTYDLQIENPQNGCVSTSQINVLENIEPPTITNELPDVLTCVTTEVDLFAMATGAGQVFDYQWTNSDGELIQNANTNNPTVSAASSYELLVMDIENGCTNTAMVLVTADLTPPVVQAGDTQELDCNTNSLFLNGTSSANTDLIWTTQNGNIISGESTENPVINAAGTYQLVGTNTQNGCTASDVVTVSQNNDIPQAIAGEGGTLNCLQSSVQLDASQSIVDANITFEWTTLDGNIESAATTLNPVVNQAGTYLLTLTNTGSNCTAVSSVEVVEDIEAPVFSLHEPAVLDCNVNTTDLMVTDLATGNYTYEWTSANATIAISNTETITANTAGVYQVQVTNTDNGCLENASVEVFENIELPVFVLAQPDTLNCMVSEVDLSTSTTANNANWTYQWTTQNGNIVSGESTENPTVNTPGNYQLEVTNSTNNCTTLEQITLAQNLETPEIEFLNPDQLDCGTTEVILDASATTSATNFQWNMVGSDLLPTNEAIVSTTIAGTYQLTVTNEASFCTDTATIAIVENIEMPTAQIEATDTLNCNTQSLTLDALNSSQGNAFDYQWSSQTATIIAAETTLQPSISQAGTYTLLVTNTENECTATASIDVAQNADVPQAIIANPAWLTCAITTLNLEATIDDSNSNIEYSWATQNGNISNAAQSLNPEINAAGIYTFSLLNTDNNCENAIQIEVFQDIESPIATIEPADILTCTTADILLDATNSSTGDLFEYNWSSPTGNITQGENSLNPTINQVGVYELLITNTENGCSSNASTEIVADESVPLAAITTPEILNCAVESTNLQADNIGTTQVTYQWTSANATILADADTANPLIGEPGTYDLLLTNPENGCTNTQSVTVLQDLALPSVDAGEGIELTCSVTDYTLQGLIEEAAVIDFVWTSIDGNFAANTATLTPQVDQAGTYVLTATNTNNFCTASDMVVLTQNENIPTAMHLILEEPLCFGDFGGLVFEQIDGGEGPFLYSIDGGDSFHPETVFQDLTPATYSLFIEDVNGCTLDTTLLIPDVSEVFAFAEPEIQLQIGSSGMLQASTNIPENNLASVLWSPADGLDCTDCLQPTSSNFEDILYTLTVTNTNGCTATAQVQLRVDEEINIYIPNAFSPNDDGINDGFTIFSRAESIQTIQRLQIYDRWGNQVFENRDFQPNDVQLGWDGFSKNKRLDPAVFTYFAEIELATGKVELFKGDVTLLD